MEPQKEKRERETKFLIICGGSGVGLLGQRKVLGIQGELHVDVSTEVSDELTKSDDYSRNVKLDLAPDAGVANKLLHYMKGQIGNLPNAGPVYMHHTEFLAENWSKHSSLKEGLGRSPALGGITIRHPQNVKELESNLRLMIEKWMVGSGAENPIVFWIVSSCAGGTGEGTHRFVGEQIVQILKTNPAARFKLNFIRIGPGTYKAVDHERVSLNAFFGIAADAAYNVRFLKDYRKVGVTTNWFYLEIPPVGVGNAVKPIRARLVEMACKALILDELQSDINTIVVNDGIGLVRVGYWGRDFDETAKYAETLGQLVSKLNKLISPDGLDEYILEKPDVAGRKDLVRQERPEPIFKGGDTIERIRAALTSDFIFRRVERKEWAFPKYTGPAELNSEAIRKLVPDWQGSIESLLGLQPGGMDKFELDFYMPQKVTLEDGTEGDERVEPLRVPKAAGDQYGPEWFRRVNAAQQVKAWANHMLDRLLPKLPKLAQDCSRIQHRRFGPDNKQKATEMAKPLWDFVESLVKVIRLTQLRDEAGFFLGRTLDDAKAVLEKAKHELEIADRAKEGREEAPVIAAELSNSLDQLTKETWLRVLDLAVKRQDDRMFRREVLKGATGLTRTGLLNVLGLRYNAEPQEIKDALRGRMGRMYSKDGVEYEAQWWDGARPPGIKAELKYRILPKLENSVRAELGIGDKDETKYLYTELGVIGLNVLGFEAVMISPPANTVVTPAYLLQGLVTLVREHLSQKNWVNTPFGQPGSKVAIVTSGVGGDPLYKPALEAAGVQPDELDRLSDFYELYQ